MSDADRHVPPAVELAQAPLPAVFAALDASARGLSSGQAHERLERVGPNEIVEERRSALLVFLGYFWGEVSP